MKDLCVQQPLDSDVKSAAYEKIQLREINAYLTCHLCKGYLIDATTISECLHSFCRCCIIKFLRENCSCPVCDVMINKANPCLKLDKTKQDIVYKLVPELFVKEMQRRKLFYQSMPAVAQKVTPEERGEDTERTIFNPSDAISLSMEYVSDDSSPGAIPALFNNNNNNNNIGDDDNPMKRYLQCPGMCRIEVLKKFVRNKYNVDTNLFHIDILYKRVPLPDHYTLIDVGYIYSWKRNEPMKFFFRITDINKVKERFDYFDGRLSPIVIRNPPTSATTKVPEGKKTKAKQIREEKRDRRNNKKPKRKKINTEKCEDITEAASKRYSDEVQQLKKDIQEEMKLNFQTGEEDCNKQVYTNITLNRHDNLEIITKIQKVSNKEGQPIGVNIINHTIKKTVQKDEKTGDTGAKIEETKAQILDDEKSNFLKSIQLTPKNSLTPPSPEKKFSPSPGNNSDRKVTFAPATSTSPACDKKRKMASPIKGVVKRAKNATPKKPFKIIIQPKNACQSGLGKVTEKPTTAEQTKIAAAVGKTNADIQTLINNCKLNIPSSLSITVNEGVETKKTPSIPPVNNYIEILKLPETPPEENNNKNKTAQSTFQKIFEEAVCKKSLTSPGSNRRKTVTPQKNAEKDSDDFACRAEMPRAALPATSVGTKTNELGMRSESLGLNYTVSVEQNNETKSSSKNNSLMVSLPINNAPTTIKDVLANNKQNNNNNNNNNNNHVSKAFLDKYNIKNLAQVSANLAEYAAAAQQAAAHNKKGAAASYQYNFQQRMFLRQVEQNWWKFSPQQQRFLDTSGAFIKYEKMLEDVSKTAAAAKLMKEN